MRALTGAAVRRIREARGETQLQFANVLGVQENTVWRWEHGHNISAAYQRLIAGLAPPPASAPRARRRAAPAA